jgi:FkbM family methyltransferase
MISEIYKNNDGTFIVFPNDAIANHLKTIGTWEPHFKIVVDNFINEDDVVIDAGANFGYNSVIMGKKIGSDGTLISFEPQRIIYQQMCGNLILNNIYNGHPINAAVGQEESTANLVPVYYEAGWVNIGDTSIGDGGEEIRVCKIDDIIDTRVNFIKIDVQGFELDALKGAKNILTNYQPDIFIEVEPHQLAKFNTTDEDLFNYIKSFGYDIYKINNDYPCDHICTTKDVSHLTEILKLVKI